MTYRQPLRLALNQAVSSHVPQVNCQPLAEPIRPLMLNQIMDHYQAGKLTELSTDTLQLARRKVNLYLTWHEQHPDFPYTVVPLASQLQPIRDGIDAILNARCGLDGMTPIHA